MRWRNVCVYVFRCADGSCRLDERLFPQNGDFVAPHELDGACRVAGFQGGWGVGGFKFYNCDLAGRVRTIRMLRMGLRKDTVDWLNMLKHVRTRR